MSDKKFKIDEEKIVEYIKELVNIPSPTGFTHKAAEYLIKNAERKNIPYYKTNKGSVIYKFEGEKSERNIMFAAHLDTLGAIVKEVKDNNELKLSSIGGYPLFYIMGNYCKIHLFDGTEMEGTILPQNPAAHVNKKLSDLKLDFDNVSVRVDFKPEDEDDKLSKYVEVGNFVSFDPHFKYVNGFVKTRHLDDKASCAVQLHIADLIREIIEVKKMKANVYFYFNITEETGQGVAGAENIDDFIVVDMGVVGDGVKGDEYNVSICAKDSTGPFNYELTHKLVEIAKDREIGYKLDVFPFYGSDAAGILYSGKDSRTALIGPGVSASHGYERTHKDALENTGKLIAGYIEEICL